MVESHLKTIKRGKIINLKYEENIDGSQGYLHSNQMVMEGSVLNGIYKGCSQWICIIVKKPIKVEA